MSAEKWFNDDHLDVPLACGMVSVCMVWAQCGWLGEQNLLRSVVYIEFLGVLYLLTLTSEWVSSISYHSIKAKRQAARKGEG